MTSYYDYVLGLIPALMVVVPAALWVAGISLTAAVTVGATGAVAIIAHALFVNVPDVPDVPEPHATETTQSTQQHANAD